jgi:hypothetical protein
VDIRRKGYSEGQPIILLCEVSNQLYLCNDSVNSSDDIISNERMISAKGIENMLNKVVMA